MGCNLECADRRDENRYDDIELTQEDIDSTAKINAAAIEKELAERKDGE